MESSIKDRIQQIMDAEQLSPTRFADTIGVQRPQISHIISERNKPGTEVIAKILTTYPSISAEWLFLGIGTMYKNERKALPSQPSLFDAPVEIPVQKEPEKPPKTVNENKITPSETSINEKTPTVIRIERNVEKIIAFYSDGTFEELEAKKKN